MKTMIMALVGTFIGLLGGLVVGYSFAPLLQSAQEQVSQNQITDFQNQISDLQGQVDTLQNQIQEKDSQISTLTSQIADLEQQIDVLEQLVPSLTKGEWNTIVTFTGSASKTTELFYIPSGTWRINWTYTGGSLAVFGFFVYPEGETVMFVESLSTMGSSQSETTYIYEGLGNFYVKLVVSVDQWTLAVEAFVPS